MPELVIATAAGTVLQQVDLSRRTKVTIGCSPRCDVVVEGQFISRHHALIVEEAGRWLVIDLSVTHGLWLDTQRVRSAVAAEGAPVRLGEVFLWFYRIGAEAVSDPPRLVADGPCRPVLRAEHLETLWRRGVIQPAVRSAA